MNAALFTGKNKIEFTSIAEPQVQADEIKVRNYAAGVCGTDISIFKGGAGSAEVTPPIVLGHEYAGEVVAVGEDVQSIKVGDKVAIDPNIYCQKCYHCRQGKEHHCENLFAIGVNRNGGFAEYSVVPEKQAFRLSDDVDYEVGAMAEPLACCIHGIDLAEIKSGSAVYIIGGGSIGQLMVQLAKLAGAYPVILSEPVELRRQIALENGADYAFDPFAVDPKQALEVIAPHGADVVIECVGNIGATQQAFDVAAKGATIVLFSVPAPDVTFPLSLFDVFAKELKIKGSFINPDTQQRAVNLINSNRLNIKPLITHQYPLDQVEEAIAKQMGNDSIKVIVNP